MARKSAVYMRKTTFKSPRCVSRLQWFTYYVNRFNKLEREDSAVMAMWYLLLIMSEDE